MHMHMHLCTHVLTQFLPLMPDAQRKRACCVRVMSQVRIRLHACTDCVQIMRRIRAFCEHKRRQTDISNVLEFCEHKDKGTSRRPKQVIHSCTWTRLSSSLSHPWSVTISESTCARVDAVRVNLSRKQRGTYIHMCVCMSLCAQLIHAYTGVHKYLMLRHCVYVCML